MTLNLLFCENYHNMLISNTSKTENALAHQASVLRSDLEKSVQDNASLYSKIGKFNDICCF